MASRTKRSRVVAAAALLFALAAPCLAYAEPTDQEKETARALMDRGDERFDKKDYAAALEAYRGAHALMHVPTTALEVAKVQEALGQLVEARSSLLEAVRYPKTPGEPEAFTTARADAERHAGALAARIPSILANVEGLPPDVVLQVTLDGVAIPAAAARLPMKVNPGKHVVVASSERTTTSSRDVEVREGDNVTIALSVTPLPPDSDATAREAGGPRPLRTAGMVTTGVGVAGLLVGGFFGLRASQKQSDAGCPGNVCRDEASASTLRDANDAATVSTIAFIAGGVITAGGVTLWYVGSKDAGSRRASTGVHVGVAPLGLTGLSAKGTF